MNIKMLASRLSGNRRLIKLVGKAAAHFPRIDNTLRLLRYHVDNWSSSARYAIAEIPLRENDKPIFMVDISHLIRRDVHTGIQRVVRSVLIQLLESPPENYKVVPVYVDETGRLMSSNAIVAKINGEHVSVESQAEPVGIRSGDVWFTADIYLRYPVAILKHLKQSGVKIVFTLYDILPIKHPQYFYKAQILEFVDWLNILAKYADQVLCISKSVMRDYSNWRDIHMPGMECEQSVGYFYLGSDIESSIPTKGVSELDEALYRTIMTRPTFLMVGTLEPRKGYVQIVHAFRILWQAGYDVNLVIIGKEGWRSHEITSLIEKASKLSNYLYWLNSVSDELLSQYYESSVALIAASYDEGFGLPLIEAAKHGTPVIARDIPVFREVAGTHAYYFNGATEEAVADDLCKWLDLSVREEQPLSRGMRRLTWKESTQMLVELIFGTYGDAVR